MRFKLDDKPVEFVLLKSVTVQTLTTCSALLVLFIVIYLSTQKKAAVAIAIMLLFIIPPFVLFRSLAFAVPIDHFLHLPNHFRIVINHVVLLAGILFQII